MNFMKSRLKYAEVYITNVCNYSCTHCQSLNNFAFKGHQSWADYQTDYQALSEHVDIDTIQIIGGEPTLNPDFENWVIGISETWPHARIEISTNGTRLDVINDNIYQILSKNKGCLWITCHDDKLYNSMLDFSNQFLDDIVSDSQPDSNSRAIWKQSYDSIKDESWPSCDDIRQFDQLPDRIKKELIDVHNLNPDSFYSIHAPRILTDKNGVEFKLELSQSFFSSAITITDQQTLKMKHNNDPVAAHEICYFKSCHQLNKGKLYKCPLVSVLPDFLDQFEVAMNDDDKTLVRAHVPISGSDSAATIFNFIKNIDQPIAQCKFCPANQKKYDFVGTDKKIKVIALKQQ